MAALLRRLGATLIDADDLAREIVLPNREAWKEIVDVFGHGILRNDHTIDRQTLRRIIFDDPQSRRKLETILHPKIRDLARERIRQAEAAGHDFVVYEAPLLFENQVHLWLRPVIVVVCDPATQRQRLQTRDHLSESEIQKHLDAQMSLDEKIKLADFVIDNSGTLEDLAHQVEAVWEKTQVT